MSSWFSLPVTNPDPIDLPDELSSSEPDWILNRNFKDRLHFEAWTGFHEAVTSVQRDLSRIPRTDPTRKAIYNLLEPVREELNDETRKDCWNESAIDGQVSVQVWRAIKQARRAILGVRKETDCLKHLCMVSQKEVRTETYAARVGINLGRTVSISNPEHIIPDYSLFAKSSDSRDNKSPLATVELKGSRAKLVHDHKHGYSAADVARNCQSAFDKRPLKKYLGDDFYVTKRFSQALTQAFHTESGAGALYNHVYAVFFYIEGKEVLQNEKTRVIVKVSGVYRCDTSLSNLHAFTAWLLLVEELVNRGRTEAIRRGKLLDSIEFVSTSSREHEDDDDSPPSVSSGENSSRPSTPKSSDSSSPVRKRQKNSNRSKTSNKKSGSSSESKKRTCTFNESPLSRAAELTKKRMSSFESFLAMCGIAGAKKEVLAFWNDDIVKCALDSNIALLGEGDFGVVRKVSLNGRSVAVKYCSRFNTNAQDCLHNEILMNCHIASRFPHLMDFAVPRLIAVGFDNWAGPVLVTEMVGYDVSASEGYLSIGNEQLHPRFSWMVCNAAISCLKALHRCGIAHRDVNLGNLRARVRRKEGTFQDMTTLSVHDFDAWWIDLGFSKLTSCPSDFEFEVKQCVSLFPFVSYSDIEANC